MTSSTGPKLQLCLLFIYLTISASRSSAQYARKSRQVDANEKYPKNVPSAILDNELKSRPLSSRTPSPLTGDLNRDDISPIVSPFKDENSNSLRESQDQQILPKNYDQSDPKAQYLLRNSEYLESFAKTQNSENSENSKSSKYSKNPDNFNSEILPKPDHNPDANLQENESFRDDQDNSDDLQPEDIIQKETQNNGVNAIKFPGLDPDEMKLVDSAILKQVEDIIQARNGSELTETQFAPETTETTTTTEKPVDQKIENVEKVETGEDAITSEQKSSAKIFFILIVLGLCIIVIHMLIKHHLHYFPESLAVMLVGMFIGFILDNIRDDNWLEAEFLHPDTFFLILLPPIILEAGYNLHKGNFFANIGSILVYAVFGTMISTFIVGSGIYMISKFNDEYELKVSEAFAYGSLVSAVDPVATIAIFSAMNVDPLLNMLVFGESILNDAVSIVLTNLFQKAGASETQESYQWMLATVLGEFSRMLVFSASLGTLIAVVSALVLKHVDLRKTPSLELGMMLIFCYVPYGVAEWSDLSGIMALLFAGIVASHYTHQNLSLVTQINLQHTLRTLAFLAETSIFAYIGMAMFSFEHDFEPGFCIGSILLILVARAANIYPLSMLVNKFRVVKINKRMQFVMWFSGLRGAIAYVLSLHLELDSTKKRHIVITGTLAVVIFTIVILGGLTYPLITFLKITGPEVKDKNERKRNSESSNENGGAVTLSKTEHASGTVETDYNSSMYSASEDELGHVDLELDDTQTKVVNNDLEMMVESPGSGSKKKRRRKKGPTGPSRVAIDPNSHHTFSGAFARIDAQILIPFLCRRITREELIENRQQMKQFASKWYDEVREKRLSSMTHQSPSVGSTVLQFVNSKRDKFQNFNPYHRMQNRKPKSRSNRNQSTSLADRNLLGNYSSSE